MVKVAIVSTSSSVTPLKDGSTRPSGCWYEELAAPFIIFKEAGYDVGVYSISGGKIPFDSSSLEEPAFTDHCKKFSSLYESLTTNTKSIADAKEEILTCDVLYLPGGHACYSDFHHKDFADVIMKFYAMGKIIASDCHGPVALCNAELKKPDGSPLVAGHEVTCFTNDEEIAVGAMESIPYSVQTSLCNLGCKWKSGENWMPHISVSGNLLTGQNPASSEALAKAVVAKF